MPLAEKGGMGAEKTKDESIFDRLRHSKAGKVSEGELSESITSFLKDRTKEASAAGRLRTEDYAGARRIGIELGPEPQEKRRKYIESYTNLVASIAGILTGEGTTGYDKSGKNIYGELSKRGKMDLQEDFITGIWGVMTSNLKMEYKVNKSEFISASLGNNCWDCDNSATLVFDVARQLGIPIEMVMVQRHVFVASEDYYVETTSRSSPGYHERWKMDKKYPSVYLITSSLEEIDSLAYDSLGIAYYLKRDYKNALTNCAKAVELNPWHADMHANLGGAYLLLQKYKEAIDEASMSIALNPSYEAYSMRGFACLMEGKFLNAASDFWEFGELRLYKLMNDFSRRVSRALRS
jgi:hypothetical protein